MTGRSQIFDMAVSNSLLRLSAVLLVVSAIVRPGDGLKCYECNSGDDPNCLTNPSNPIDCDNSPTIDKGTGDLTYAKFACLKGVIKNKAIGEQLVIRSCFLDLPKMTCTATAKPNSPFHADVIHCEICKSDLCNSSNHLISSSLPVLLPCIVALILSYMY